MPKKKKKGGKKYKASWNMKIWNKLYTKGDIILDEDLSVVLANFPDNIYIV